MYKSKNILDSFLVLVLFIICLLAETNLNEIQIILEFFVLIYMIFKIVSDGKIKKSEGKLLLILFLISFFSFISNSFFDFLLNFKIFLLAIITIIYFRNKYLDERLVNFIIFTNLFILIIKLFFGVYLLPTKGLDLKFQDLLDSRPLGLFYNTHMSAYVTGIYFIYKSNLSQFYLNSVKGAGFIYLFFSRFTLFAFIASFISKFRFLFFIFVGAIFTTFVGLIFFITTDYIFSISHSMRIILEQFLDLESYQVLFNITPKSYSNYLNSQINYDSLFTATGNEVGNEIQLFTLYVEGGFILASSYLFFLIRRLKKFRVFLIFSLIHYGFATTPFVLFLFLNYENRLKHINIKLSD